MTKEEYKYEVLSTSSNTELNLLANRHEKFRLIFLDPPYANQSVEQDIEQMIKQDLLDDIALIVCEVASDVTSPTDIRSEEHTSELQSRGHLVCRLLLEKQHRIL